MLVCLLTTILVKTIWTIPAFPPPPITMLIFHGLRKQDLFIDLSLVSTLSVGKGGAKKAVKEEQALLVIITMEACTVNSLLFAQNVTSVPKSFDPDCSLTYLTH